MSEADTKDVTGSIAGVVGIDTLSLAGNEYSASEWNASHSETLPENMQGNITAAKISNQVIAEGGNACYNLRYNPYSEKKSKLKV